MDKQPHKVAKKQKLREAKVGDKLEVDDKMRKSNIAFLDELWIHKTLHSLKTANEKAGWNLEVQNRTSAIYRISFKSIL